MCDTEIQSQRHRTRVIDEVSRYLDVSTVLTPASNDLLSQCLGFMCSVEQVSDLINRPVMCLFGTRVGVTRANMVT